MQKRQKNLLILYDNIENISWHYMEHSVPCLLHSLWGSYQGIQGNEICDTWIHRGVTFLLFFCIPHNRVFDFNRIRGSSLSCMGIQEFSS